MRTVIAAVVVIWLLVGVLAAASTRLLRRRPEGQLQGDQRHGADDRGGAAQLRRRQPEGELQDPAALEVARPVRQGRVVPSWAHARLICTSRLVGMVVNGGAVAELFS